MVCANENTFLRRKTKQEQNKNARAKKGILSVDKKVIIVVTTKERNWEGREIEPEHKTGQIFKQTLVKNTWLFFLPEQFCFSTKSKKLGQKDSKSQVEVTNRIGNNLPCLYAWLINTHSWSGKHASNTITELATIEKDNPASLMFHGIWLEKSLFWTQKPTF